MLIKKKLISISYPRFRSYVGMQDPDGTAPFRTADSVSKHLMLVLVLLGVESLPVRRLSLGRFRLERGEVDVHEHRYSDTG
jgi:hypothetical protein